VNISQHVLLSLQRGGDEFFKHSVKGDESWNKRQSMGFRHRRSSSNRIRSSVKRQMSEPCWSVCATLQGTNHSGFLPTATNINCEMYCERRTELKAVIRQVRPHMQQHFLPHDTVRPNYICTHSTPWCHRRVASFGVVGVSSLFRNRMNILNGVTWLGR